MTTVLQSQKTANLPHFLVEGLKRLEHGFTVLALFFYSNSIVPLIMANGASEGDGFDYNSLNYSLSHALYLLTYMLTTIFILLRWKKVLYTLLQNKYISGLLILVPLSALWSVSPSNTLSASVSMIGSSLMGVYLASRYTLQEQLRLLGVAFGLTIGLSLLFILLLPKYGIMGGIHSGAWRGIFTHKNLFGQMMVFSSMLFFVLAKTHKASFLYWLGFFLSFIFIIFSTSSSALLNFLLAISLTLSTRFFCLSKKRFILLLVAFIAIGCSLSVWIPEILATALGLVGKDLTFTGRTDIWSYVIDKIIERPWLGYGHNAFWHGLSGESAYVIRALRWNAPNGHNGFLDLWLELGFLGLTMYIFTFWETFFKATLLTRITQSWEQNWILVFFVFIITSNLSESSLMLRNGFFWIMFVSIVFSESLLFKRLLTYRHQARLRNT
ncbi:MAG: O-antigen ligase family protein [Cyanobacteria bacterium P01_C01_bin.72]